MFYLGLAKVPLTNGGFRKLTESNDIQVLTSGMGALRSPAIYMFNNKDVFVHVRKGDSVAWLVNLEE